MREIPFYIPSIDQSEKNLLNEVLELRGASKIEELEDLMCEYTGSKYAVSTSSWSGSIHLSMFALGLKRGDKILCSVNSHPAISEAVRHFDAEPIFVDVDIDSFNMSIEALKEALVKFKHKKLKAVVITHIGGVSAKLDEIYKVAKENKIKVVEDASTSLGASYNGSMLGSTGGDLTTFSLGNNQKNSLTNCGIITTDDIKLYQRAKLIRYHSIESREWDNRGTLGYIYDVKDIGINYKTSELEAACAIAKLQKLNDIISRRQEITDIYYSELESISLVTLPKRFAENTYEHFTIKIDKNRDDFARGLKTKGVLTNLFFAPLHLLTYYKQKYSLKVNDYPNALINYQQALSLPCYSKMSNEDVLYVCRAIKEVADSRG
jgi:dTDP-4-amino-4,6-dideoxygalactose transaminase